MGEVDPWVAVFDLEVLEVVRFLLVDVILAVRVRGVLRKAALSRATTLISTRRARRWCLLVKFVLLESW